MQNFRSKASNLVIIQFLKPLLLVPTRSLNPHLRPFGLHTYTKMKVEYPPPGATPAPSTGKAKKKNTLSQSLREFFKPTRHAVFYFYFFTSIGLCLHAHPKPKMTGKFQLPYFQKLNGILHVF